MGLKLSAVHVNIFSDQVMAISGQVESTIKNGEVVEHSLNMKYVELNNIHFIRVVTQAYFLV